MSTGSAYRPPPPPFVRRGVGHHHNIYGRERSGSGYRSQSPGFGHRSVQSNLGNSYYRSSNRPRFESPPSERYHGHRLPYNSDRFYGQQRRSEHSIHGRPYYDERPLSEHRMERRRSPDRHYQPPDESIGDIARSSWASVNRARERSIHDGRPYDESQLPVHRMGPRRSPDRHNQPPDESIEDIARSSWASADRARESSCKYESPSAYRSDTGMTDINKRSPHAHKRKRKRKRKRNTRECRSVEGDLGSSDKQIHETSTEVPKESKTALNAAGLEKKRAGECEQKVKVVDLVDDSESDDGQQLSPIGSDVEIIDSPLGRQNRGYACPSSWSGVEDQSSDEECMAVSQSTSVVNARISYPHPRSDCGVYAFDDSIQPTERSSLKSRRSCPNCYCYVCDIKAILCKSWKLHCLAHSKNERWAQLRRAYADEKKTGDSSNVDKAISQLNAPCELICID
eukprot:scaffold682740_cov63-Attheya_sp.AAC.1